MFHTTEPSCNTDDMLLLFDYVHLIKIFQNNWITEGYQEQVFHAGVGNNTAKCVDIKAFYNLDANQIVKLSRLTEVSGICLVKAYRKTICSWLQNFCDETLSVLEVHPG